VIDLHSWRPNGSEMTEIRLLGKIDFKHRSFQPKIFLFLSYGI